MARSLNSEENALYNNNWEALWQYTQGLKTNSARGKYMTLVNKGNNSEGFVFTLQKPNGEIIDIF